MTPRRGTAVATALLAAALATAGCGLGPGAGIDPVHLTVSRDYGSRVLLDRSVGDLAESATVMRVLDRSAPITTRYGGGFVQSIDGLASRASGGSPEDWFFYVNGVESEVGAAEYALRGAERVWWDYRDWGHAMRVPAVVGSWPEPLRSGYEGKRAPVRVECMGAAEACRLARRRIEALGVPLAGGQAKGAIRVLVGPWGRLRADPAAALLEGGPQASGVFADFRAAAGGFRLEGLREDGSVGRRFGAGAGLVAATRRNEAPPVWIVTGAGRAGARRAAGLLDAADLRNRYAVATEGGRAMALPLR